MTKQAEFKDLPEEVVVEIGKYLSPSDVNNCFAVSHAWHHTFSQDPFWKKHCNMAFVCYLKSTPCEAYDIKTDIEEYLNVAQMNEGRVNYIYQNQLSKNWIHGRYYEKKLDCINVTDYSFTYPSIEFYENDLIFYITKKSVQIYDISKSSHVFVREVNYNLPYDIDVVTRFLHKISNDRFLVSQNNLVTVFDISTTQEWPVSFTFLLDKTEEESTVATESENVLHYMSYHINPLSTYPFNCEQITTGDFYVGIVKTREFLDNRIVWMHIWNITTKKKLKVESVPIVTNESQRICNVFMGNSETPSDNIIVECKLRSIVRENNIMLENHYFVYNLKKLMFYPLRVFASFWLGEDVRPILNDYLYVISTEGLFIYDYYQHCHVIRQYPYSGRMFMTIAGDSVVTITSNFEEMKVLKLHSGDIETFNGYWNNGIADQLWDKFFVFNSFEKSGDVYFWYFGKRSEKIFQCKGRFLAHNKFFTRLLVKYIDEIRLLSFW